MISAGISLTKAPRLVAAKRCLVLSRSIGSQRVVAMSGTNVYDIVVKGDLKDNILADCPFSHRALLALEEKKIPYSKTFVDLDNKPQWLLDINPAGSVPIIKDLATGEWTVDSGVIVDMLEKKFPEPSYGTVEGSPQVGLPIFGAFKEFAKAETEEEAKEKEAALVSALEELDTYLQKTNPYIGGDSPCSTDLLIMPRLYHLKIALKHFRDWEIPSHLTALKKYIDTFMERDSWKNTYYSPELVIKGWVRHGIQVHK